MLARFRTSLATLLVFVAFFASGAASLVAEVTWNRMLIVVVGNSLDAAAMIIIIFMGGLGLGSYLGGRFFAGRRPSLVPYLVLELAIGLYVLASPGLFDLLTGLFTDLATSTNNRTGLTIARMVVSMLALLLPATLMGATFPAIVSGAALDSPTRRTARTGYLYSANTLGAAIGCFAAGYHLLLEFGVQTTLTVAFVMYVAAATCALAAVLLWGRQDVEKPATTDPAATEARPALRRFLYLATAIIGFVSLGYEVLLTRISILYLGNSVSVFPLVLTAFLLGTGISAVVGTWLYGVVRRRSAAADKIFGVAALLAGALVLLTPYLLLTDLVLSTDHFARFADAAPMNPWPILALLIAPTALIGALLPLAIRMLQPTGRGAATREAATLYSLNTAGGLLGAGLANHLLVPLVGIQGALLFLMALLAVVGLYNLLFDRPPSRRWAVALGGTAAAVTALVFVLPSMMGLYAEKIAESTRARTASVPLVLEGRAATVTVIDQVDPKLGTYRDMYLNGVEEASTRFWHVQLFKLLGVLPPLLHEGSEPTDAMVIAFGAGITAGSVLADANVKSLDVVDLNPDIEGINDLFTEVNGDVFHQPRFNFHNDDGRNYLVTCNKQYDLIIGDSTHPRAYDSWILYTEEFYRAVKERLRPGGIFAQWVPVLGSMRGELMGIHLNTFRTVFPNTTVWYIYGSDQAFLMATPEPLAIDATALQAKLDALPAWFRAQEYQLDTVARVGGFFWMGPPAMGAMIGAETRVNTDDVHYFDKQSAVFPLPPQRQMPRYQTSVLPSLVNLDPALTSALQKEQKVAGHLGNYAFYLQQPELFAAYCLMPENGNALYLMSEVYGDQIPESGAFCEDKELARYREMLAAHPDNPTIKNALADALAGAGQLDEARALAEQAAAAEPGNGMILDTLGWIQFKQEQYGSARETLTRALAALPEHPIVLHHLGATCQATGEFDAARGYLERALAAATDFPGAEDARARLRQMR